MDKIKQVQEIVGMLVYYLWAVDSKMVTALGSIAAHQLHGTKDVITTCQHLLDYADKNPNATIWYLASNMILTLHSDASYLSEYNSKVGL